MNSTKWDSLSTFVKYLGKQGVAIVDETEKGWYIQYIDRTYLKRKEELDKQKKADLVSKERKEDEGGGAPRLALCITHPSTRRPLPRTRRRKRRGSSA